MMMIACYICHTPTEIPEGYHLCDTLYCFGCKRRLEIINKNVKAAHSRKAPTWTPQQEMELRQSQNYVWKSTEQLLEHMRGNGYFVCF